MKFVVDIAVRPGVVACWAGLLASAVASCGGGPEGLQDSADNAGRTGESPVASPAPAAPSATGSSPVSDTPSGQPADCWNVATGCHCTHESQVVACEGKRYSFGDYVSCTGERECVNGAWGPCVSTRFVGK